jgi:multidrug resistance efflux pump
MKESCEDRVNNYWSLSQQLEAQLNKALADNADLMETIRGLRLDIETYKSTLEGLQRRVVRFEHLGNAIGEIA